MMYREWMDDARCAEGVDSDSFFPDLPGVPGKRQAERAALVCRECPVAVQCRKYALEIGATHGVWAGTLEPGGRGSRGETFRRPINHGTIAGYRAHLRHHERACEPCRIANNYATAERRATRRVLSDTSVRQIGQA